MVLRKIDFEIDQASALAFLTEPNVHGRPNSDVVRIYVNGTDLINERERGWIIYFPASTSIEAAALYAAPFQRVTQRVFPKYGQSRKRWWIHERPLAELVDNLTDLSRYLCIVKHAKHRIFSWVSATELVSNATEAFTRDDDYFLGLLHSHIHEVWAFATGTQVREKESGFRYTPTTCFETFHFPEPTAGQRDAVAEAARQLTTLRDAWLNPPEWVRTEVLTFPGSIGGPWGRYVTDANAAGVGTVRYPRTVPADGVHAVMLKKRTLTNLYNERPGWLAHAHKRLDAAVAAAYGWPADLPDDQVLARLLALNLARAAG